MLKIKSAKKRRLEKALQAIASRHSTVVVTGGSSGIGRAFLELAGTLPKNILICNLSRTKPANFFDRENFENVPCDVSDNAQIREAFSQVMALRKDRGLEKGGILLVNNAGFGGYGPFPEPDIDHNCGMIDVNVRGLTCLSGLFVPVLCECGGGIINVSSTAAWQPCPFLGVYAATKAYVMSFSLALDWELRKRGARCLCLCPGPTTTNFFRRAGFKERPVGSAYGHEAPEVAAAALEAYAGGRNLKVVGFLNSVLAFMNYFIPRSLMCRISGPILERVRSGGVKK